MVMRRMLDGWSSIPPQRRKRWVLFLIGAIVVGWIFWTSRQVLGPYFVGLALAYILAPVVEWLQRALEWIGKHKRLHFFKRIARPMGILVAYLLLIALLAGFIALVIPLVTEQAEALWNIRYRIWEAISRLAEDLIEQYKLLPVELKQQAEESLGRFNELMTKSLEQAARSTFVVITYTASVVLGIFIVPFWAFYLLKDFTQLKDAALNVIPDMLRDDVTKVIRLLDTTLGAYLRGQIFLGFVIGSVSTAFYTIFGVNFALLLGMVAGVLELVPNIGPTVSAILAVTVALAQDPGKALGVAIFGVAIQQIENLFLSPRVLGQSVGLHPVIVMVVLVIGSEIAGIPGLFLAPVVTAVMRDLFKYFYYRFNDDPYSPDEALQQVWGGNGFSMEL